MERKAVKRYVYKKGDGREIVRVQIFSDTLNRFLVSRSYWYMNRVKDSETGKFGCEYIDSPLLQELLELYAYLRENDDSQLDACRYRRPNKQIAELEIE